jgi:sulfur-oxidizing protein SoxY
MTAIDSGSITRRHFLRAIAVIAASGAALANVFYIRTASAQAIASGLPLPDEPVAATLKRLFGGRKFLPGDGKIKLDLPLIAEDGGNVAVALDTSLPVSGPARVIHIYIIADKNRRPMLAKFSFTPDSGRAFISTSVRLATTTDVRAVVEMSDGTLYAMQRNVRVTISGCDLPPQS